MSTLPVFESSGFVRFLRNSDSCPSNDSPLFQARQKIGRVLGRTLLSGLLIFCVSILMAPPVHALVDDSTDSSMTESSMTAQSMQPYIDRALGRIDEFTLDNGMKFIVMERHQAPVVSFMTYVNAGGVDEAEGKTGAAHYLEHLAFKGTPRIGTTDYASEQVWLEQLDILFQDIKQAEMQGDAAALADLTTQFDEAKRQASQYVNQNQYSQIVEQAGGVGLNATTSLDETRYFYSFPSNKLELWMSLESERFLEPVFREFFEEKDVILEERRMRVDNSPVGTMIEQFLGTAFQVHPYRRPAIGYEADLRVMTREDVRDFFNAYYTPDNIICAVVGDVNFDEVKALAERYFGRYVTRSVETRSLPVEPPQTEPRELTLTMPTQPWYFEGYHIPGVNDEKYLTYQMLGAILNSGRTSRLYQSLVEDQQIALSVRNWQGFPGDRFPNLMVFYALSAPNHTLDEISEAIAVELNRLTTEPVSSAELDRVKTQWRASLLRTLDSNQGMASLLPDYEAKTGSWRSLFDSLRTIDDITADDVQAAAQAAFRPENRTVGRLISQS